MNRCFLAIDVDDHVKVNVKVTQGHVKDCEGDVKLVESENLHFTVKFLGNLDGDQIKRVVDVLNTLVKSESPSNVSVHGLGLFGPKDAPRMIWAGVNDEDAYLDGLFARISEVVKGISPENDEKNGIPHMTIARVRSARNINKLREIILKESETFFGKTLVNAIKLKVSTSTPWVSDTPMSRFFPSRKRNLVSFF